MPETKKRSMKQTRETDGQRKDKKVCHNVISPFLKIKSIFVKIVVPNTIQDF